MSDPIDDAIIAAEAKPAIVKMHQIQVSLDYSGGRPVVVAVPVDMTADERAEFAAWVLTPKDGLSAGLAAMNEQVRPSGIQIARAMPGGKPA